MPTITAMTANRRDPNRVAVRVDGRVAATVSVRSIAVLRLAVGSECDASLLVELERAASDDKAMQQAINRLGRRAMSRGQIERKLAELGYDETTCERVLDRLGDIGLIDDRAFAEALVRQVKRRKPAGAMLLRQKLREKHIPADLIEQVISDTTDVQENVDGAVQLARKRAGTLGHVDATTRRRRIYGLLARRGFDPQTINLAMRQLDDEQPALD